jgi:hypothetical protein
MNRSRALLVLAVVLAAAAAQLSGANRALAAGSTFTEITAGLPGVSTSSVAWGDYDLDGKLDILLTGDRGDVPVAKIYRNNGGGSFTEDTTADEHLAGVKWGSAAWGDYDSDGDLDILLTGDTGSGLVSKVYRNDATVDGRTFTDTGAALTGVHYGSSAWGDYNSDGKLDILLTGMDGSNNPVAKIYENNNGASFSEDTVADQNLTDVSYGSVAWGDYNSDGRPDILLTGFGAGTWVSEIYKNNGAGSAFTEDETADQNLTGVYQSEVAWGDYNSDGRLDILLTGFDGSSNRVTEIYENMDDGTFEGNITTEGDGLTDVAFGSVAWGDYNSDGKSDILLAGESQTSPTQECPSSVFTNNGVGNKFTKDAAAVLAGACQGSVAWGDYNSDGKLDILLTGYNPSSYMYESHVYRNDIATANTAPSAPANLTASPVSGSEVAVSWSAASDGSQTPAAALTYNVRVGTTPGASDVVAPMSRLSDGRRFVPQAGNAGERTSYTLTDLTPGATYYWSVQALDSGFAGSGFATEGSFTMAPVFAFSSATYSVGEAGPSATITIKRNGLTTGTDSVHFTTADGTTSAGSDYTDETQIVNFAANQTQKTVDIPITDDSSVEADEMVLLSLSGASSGATIGSPSSATLTITDNDRSFAFSSATYSVGEAGPSATITITRTGLTTSSDSVHIATSNGTAASGSDYTAVSQDVSFNPDQTTKTVDVPITNDSSIESSETVLLALSSPSTSAELGTPSSATLTIVDNDRAFAFSSASYSVGEADGTATVTIERTGLTSGSDTVNFATSNGTATAGSDYTAVTQTVSFAAGETSKTVSVPITNESAVESSETVLLSLSSPSTGATLGTPSAATLTIVDNDSPPDTHPATNTSKGKLVSAKLSKKSFLSSQARKVKLTCKFSPKSKLFAYVLSLKKGAKWAAVNNVRKTGSFTKLTWTVKQLFAGKSVTRGTYRLKLSADKNSKTLSFRVR